MSTEEDFPNFGVFRDCFSSSILQRLNQEPSKKPKRPSNRIGKGRKNESLDTEIGVLNEHVNDVNSEELIDFIDVRILTCPHLSLFRRSDWF
jgi:hypothetical protein